MRSRRWRVRTLLLLGALLALAALRFLLLDSRPSAKVARVEDTPRVFVAPDFAAVVPGAREKVRSIREALEIPGLAVAVGVEGRLVWSQAFGFADREGGVPATRTTRFRVGSVSKPLTAAAVALLHEKGLLDLDAPIQRYVPSFPEKEFPITTRLLAGHLAGIRHYLGEEFRIRRRYATVLEGLEIFRDDPLLHPPGTRFAYSSYGWNLISAAVEGASGEEFLSFMDRHVFGPLGMSHTEADRAEAEIPERTRFYERGEAGGIGEAPPVDLSHKWAGGGFLSTPEDLVRFGSAHLGEGFLREETLELLFTSQRTSAGEETGYGIGWRVDSDAKRGRFAVHTGSSVGGSAILVVFRDDRAVFAMAANLSSERTERWKANDPVVVPDLFVEEIRRRRSGEAR